MNKLILLITQSSEQIQLILFLSLLFVCWNIENLAGVLTNYKKWRHAFSNVPFIFTNLPVQFLLGIAFIKVAAWTSAHHFGIAYIFPAMKNPLYQFLLAFVLLDLGEYLYHVIMHKAKRLWMFHIVHHSDPVVDVSTTLREHPGENLIRLSFTLLWFTLSGALLWMLFLRQIIQVFTTLFAHMNYKLPEGLNRALGLVFITPNLHQVHHHYKQPYTDCNYGDVLSIWDRLFGTFCHAPACALTFGVDTHMQEKDIRKFASVFTIPFGRYRSSEEYNN